MMWTTDITQLINKLGQLADKRPFGEYERFDRAAFLRDPHTSAGTSLFHSFLLKMRTRRKRAGNFQWGGVLFSLQPSSRTPLSFSLSVPLLLPLSPSLSFSFSASVAPSLSVFRSLSSAWWSCGDSAVSSALSSRPCNL